MLNTPPNIVKRDVVTKHSGGYYIDGAGRLFGPKVEYRPIPEALTQSQIIPRNVILHTESGPRYTRLQALWNYLNRADITGEPHGLVDRDGAVWQVVPFTRRADNNYSANSWTFDYKRYGAISFETSDDGFATIERTPWNVAQLGALVGVLTAICCTYGISCAAPAKWSDSGIGHHSLFPYGGIGSKAWTNVRGKTCPGRARIAQMDFIRRDVAMRVAGYHMANGTECPA